MQDLWTLKYRPKALKEILGNEHSIETLAELVKSGSLPHLVFYGPKNSGKTTAALVLAAELYGETWENNFTYFNASDFFDQGKNYLVRDKRFVRILGTDDPKKIYKSVLDIFKEIINEYAGTASIDADYKLIYIDSAGSLTPDAQHALRRIMEKYSATTRFILSTTHFSKLISPLRSRGLQLFFTTVPDEALKPHLRAIAAAESLNLSEDALEAIIYSSKGNVAKAVWALQLASLKAGEAVITGETVFEVSLESRDEAIDRLFEAAVSGDFMACRALLDELLIEKGLLGSEILEGLSEVAVESGETDEDVARMLVKIAGTDFFIVDAANERIQLEKLVSDISS